MTANTPYSAPCAVVGDAQPRKREVWRGLLAGLLTKLLFVAVIVLTTYLLRPFVWFAFTHAPYDATVEPKSAEWLFIQFLGFAASVAAGAAVARWSNPGSWIAPAIYAAAALAIVLIAPFPATDSMVRLWIWMLESPVGVVLGAMAYIRHEVSAIHEA